MFSPSDTIVALATPAGRAGLAVVRISGPDARVIAGAILTHRRPLAPRRATLTSVLGRTFGTGGGAETVDRVVATFFAAPASYTGEDVVEISAHGSPVVVMQVIRAAVGSGARLAEAGEFTFRAFVNGRLDLVQAEAVADLVDAVTPLQARTALDQLEGTLTARIGEIDRALFNLVAGLEASIDFPDEAYHFLGAGTVEEAVEARAADVRALLRGATRGRLIREGRQVVILGRPNVGKSSLFNYLVGVDRAIVTPVPGTTRDLVTETVEVAGIQVCLVDTAGIRATSDQVEREGVSRARGASRVADLVLLVLDRSEPLAPGDLALVEETATADRLVLINKCDLPGAWSGADLKAGGDHAIQVSLTDGTGLDALDRALVVALQGAGESRDRPAVTNLRHVGLLERALAALERAGDSLRRSGGTLPEEFVLVELGEAKSALEEITGARSSEDLLQHIFARFCVGK